MSADFFYPPGSSNITSIASVGPNSAPIPSSSDLIGGKSPTATLLPILVDASGHILTVAATGSLQDVNLLDVGGVAITLGQKAMAASLPVVIASDQSTLAISAASLPLPAGASTSALQTSGNASLTSIDGKLNSLGQKAMAASVPVVIASDQSTLTVSVSNFPATQPVSGTVAVSNFPATQPVSGTVSVSNFPATQAVTQSTSPWVISGTVTANAGTGTLLVDGSAHTQPVSGTVAANATPQTTSGTITQAAVTVGTSAVRCTVSGSAPNAARKALIVEPDPASTAKFYIGSSGVASSGASRGIPLAAGAQFLANFDASDFYIISDTAAQTFFVVEEV